MPPLRNMPSAKALKTERTHEENQERYECPHWLFFMVSPAHTRHRAYIAASRRSDRSLEARVESARRASDIHKRRTGRALKVTEQDVVNEEMYEEEDDDLPMQYRRLTAHLQTGSADFNRRLSNYLTNHVAMRSALDQAIANAYAQQYPDAPQFAHNQNTFPSPFPSQPARARQSPTLFQPYPSPSAAGYRAGHLARSSQGTSSYSSGMPAPTSAHATPSMDHRRLSDSPTSSSHSPVDSSMPHNMQRNMSRTLTSPAGNPTQTPPGVPPQHSRRMSAPVRSNPPNRPGPPHLQQMDGLSNMSPFTTSLPPESQMLLGPALDPNDPTTAMLMAGSEDLPMPFNYNSQPKPKPRGFNQSFDGMSTTLAPSALDMQSTRMSNHQHAQANLGTMSSAQSSMPLSHQGSVSDFNKAQQPNLFPAPSSSQGSDGSTTGLDNSWDAFINDGSWAENPT